MSESKEKDKIEDGNLAAESQQNGAVEESDETPEVDAAAPKVVPSPNSKSNSVSEAGEPTTSRIVKRAMFLLIRCKKLKNFLGKLGCFGFTARNC